MDDKNQKLILFLLGNSAVGKTSFIKRYVNDISDDNYQPTIGIDFFSKMIKLETGEYLKLLFYDTAGQERYKSISMNLIKNTDGIFLMYDVTEQRSFEEINGWIGSIKEVKGDNFPIILIGNKCELEKRVITKVEGEKFAKEQGFSFIETSCKEGINIEESVQVLVSKIIENKKLKENKEEQNGNYKIRKNENFKLLKLQKKEKNKKKCCS